MDEQMENINLMKRVIALSPILTPEELNLLNIAYKNPIASRRSSLNDVLEFINRESPASCPSRVQKLQMFRDTLLEEIKEICLDLINLIDTSLLPAANEPQQRVSFEKMKGDYYRYICEKRDKADIEDLIQKANECYQSGMTIAQEELDNANSTYLGLVLNYSVFLYDIMELKNEAIEISKKAFNDAEYMTSSMNDTAYKDTIMVLRLLKTNFVNWEKEIQD